LYETKQHIIIDCELQVRNESKPEVAGQVLAFSLLLVLNFLNAELRSFGCEIVVGDALDTARWLLGEGRVAWEYACRALILSNDGGHQKFVHVICMFDIFLKLSRRINASSRDATCSTAT